MSVFDATSRVKRSVSDPLTDHKLPHPKSLSWGAINSPSALAGTKGAQCDLVHGDQWHEIKGNHNQHIQQNQTIKVVGKHKETLVESCHQNIIGPHIVLNNDVRNETRLGVFTKTYGDNWSQQKDWGNVSRMDMNLSCIKGFQAANTSVNVASSVLSIGLTGVVAQATGVSANATGAIFEAHGWSNKDGLVETESGIVHEVLTPTCFTDFIGFGALFGVVIPD